VTTGRFSIFVTATALSVACGEVRGPPLTEVDSGAGGRVTGSSQAASGGASTAGGATAGTGGASMPPVRLDGGAVFCGSQVIVLVARSRTGDAGEPCGWEMPARVGVPLAPGTFTVQFEDETVSRYELAAQIIPNDAACTTLGRDAGVYYDDPRKPTAILGCPNVCSQLPFAAPGVSGGVMEAVVSLPPCG
jgi:hypothetical protein